MTYVTSSDLTSRQVAFGKKKFRNFKSWNITSNSTKFRYITSADIQKKSSLPGARGLVGELQLALHPHLQADQGPAPRLPH
jgi:hypothetical protein